MADRCGACARSTDDPPERPSLFGAAALGPSFTYRSRRVSPQAHPASPRLARPRRVNRLAHRNRLRRSQVAAAVAIIGRTHGVNLDPTHEVNRMRDAYEDGRPLIVGRRVAELYALVLNTTVDAVANKLPAVEAERPNIRPPA
jgi:hypothetical protein